MKMQNIKALESLSMFCHICGLITVIIGLVIVFIDLINSDFKQIQVGIFIFSTGYAFVKIASKISSVIMDERRYQY